MNHTYGIIHPCIRIRDTCILDKCNIDTCILDKCNMDTLRA